MAGVQQQQPQQQQQMAAGELFEPVVKQCHLTDATWCNCHTKLMQQHRA
jgi:hypothetical protein